MLVAGIGLATAGCGGGASTSPPPSTEESGSAGGPAVEHATGPRDVLVDVRSGIGAYAPISLTVDDRPDFRLYGDGTVFARVDSEEPGLPEVSTYVLSQDGIEAVLEAAGSAGLLAEAPDYGQPGITDVGSTLVVVRANGAQFDHSAWALGIEPGDDPLLTPAQRQARDALGAFVELVTELPQRRPDLLAGQPGPFEPAAVDVMAWQVEGDAGGAEVADWPLSQPLGELPAAGPVESRCATVSGGDLRAIAQAVAASGGNPLWRSEGAVYEVGYRTLLPGDEGCSASSGA